MSVLMEFAIFPTDKGKSVSSDVSKVIKLISKSGFPYQLTAMGTLIETNTVKQALSIVEQASEILEKNSARIYSTLKLDIKKGAENMLLNKVKSIEEKL
ncbi:MAG: MTH1187 family thiamine-binding protein [Salinivirgaceae bacterium]|jgi:uncharacterized protein (TIGR00106 family)|nr:MTH1187 family thiamine-binding protein [Salinivirgaceae bacterium]